jgi:hypothetical protein
MAPGVDRLDPDVAVVGDDHRDPRADRALPNDERAVAADQRRVPDPDAAHVRDRVGRARPAASDRDAEISCSHLRLLEATRRALERRSGRGCLSSRA